MAPFLKSSNNLSTFRCSPKVVLPTWLELRHRCWGDLITQSIAYTTPCTTHTHTPSYIYNIYPLMEHHPKKPQLCRNTLFIPTFFLMYLFCFACSFQTQVGQGDYCQMSVCLTSDNTNTKQKTNDNIGQQFVATKPSSPRPPQKIGKHFCYLVSRGYTFLFVLYNRIQQPDE